jgi:hypothetical protein
MGLGCVRLHGGVPSNKRGELMDRFHDDEVCQVFISTDAGGTGLNLQCASVLVNLDIPWNPAVLDQRVARIHRLGQRNKVQVLHLVAPDSYEEHVLGLVRGKRDLFENVVDGDASEDVVGVSKRLAEVLAEDLAGPAEKDETASTGSLEPPAEAAPEEDVPPQAMPPEVRAEQPTLPDADSGIAEEVQRCIVELQRDFGQRIGRILGAKGGLLVVLDAVDETDDVHAAAISERVPIALIDPRTLKGLQRLGAANPAADAESLYEAPAQPVTTQNPLERRARQKLEAAEVLLRQGCPGPAGELLLGALLCAGALLCGLDEPPDHRKAAVWLYADALPTGKLRQEDAFLIMRAMTLAETEDQVPADLLASLAADASRFIEENFNQDR